MVYVGSHLLWLLHGVIQDRSSARFFGGLWRVVNVSFRTTTTFTVLLRVDYVRILRTVLVKRGRASSHFHRTFRLVTVRYQGNSPAVVIVVVCVVFAS